MFLNIFSLKNIHNKRFIPFRFSYPKRNSVILLSNIFVPKKTTRNSIYSYKYLDYFLRKGKVKDLEILRRSLSTSLRLLNQASKKVDPNDLKPPGNAGGTLMVLFVLFILLYNMISTPRLRPHSYVSWDEFKNEMLAKGEVKEIAEGLMDGHIGIVLHEGAILKKKAPPTRIYFLRVPDTISFEKRLREAEAELGIPPEHRLVIQDFQGVNAKRVKENITYGIIFLILMALIFWRYSNMKLNMDFKLDFPNITKAKFTLVDPMAGEGTEVRFSDVAGLKEAKVEILDFVDYLKRPEIYRNLGAKVPKGALLLGPPGCGKTLLAKAVATEASVPFLSMNGSEFIEIVGGLGASRVRDLFKEAKKRSPCIVYIDEIDAIGKKRGAESAGHNEGEHTLNQLLVEMDGIVSNEGVMLLASTNRAEVLDAALLRRGRFDRQILIDLPTFEERREIFEYHLKNINLEHKPTVYSRRMSHLTPGFSGADIANVCNEAALHAARLKKKIVQAEDLEYAVERVVGGTEKRSSAISPQEKKMLAYYESGKALIGWLSQYGEALLKITIVSRTDQPGGWTQFSPTDKFLYSLEDLRGKMCMGLGGRVAITLLFNCVTSAGEKDLKKVTKLAYAQVRRFGMNDTVGLVSFDVDGADEGLKKPYSKVLANMFDEEARRLITEVYKETEKLLVENKDKLITLAEELLVKETLNYNDVEKLIGPPSFKGKKLVDPLEFALSLDQAAGGGGPPETKHENESVS